MLEQSDCAFAVKWRLLRLCFSNKDSKFWFALCYSNVVVMN